MNILFIHEADWINKVVLDFHNLSESLSLLGHKVYAIDYKDKWRKTRLLDFGSLKTEEHELVSRAIPGSSVHLRSRGFIKIPLLSRLSVAFTQYSLIKRTIKERKIDVIVLYSVPTNGLQVLYLARRSKIPLVFRSIDILHQLVKYPILRLPTKILEKIVYKNVDEILTITPKLSQYVMDLGAHISKTKLLLLPIDRTMFHQSIDCSELQQKWGINKTDPVIVFMGTLFEFSGLDLFIRHLPRIIEQIPEVKLVIVGDGPQRLKLRQLISELGLENQVLMTGLQPYSTMPQYINLATVCINTFLINNTTRDIFPGKIIQYLACGKALVATPLPGIMALIRGEADGVIYADSAEKMVGEIINLLKSPEKRHNLEQAGLHYVNRTHDYQAIASQLEKDLMELIRQKATKTLTI
jgi:glycosyltransferase involved in cell wall biosynthesis